MVAVAQLVRALVCGTGGRGFKSPQPPHFNIIVFSSLEFLIQTLKLKMNDF